MKPRFFSGLCILVLLTACGQTGGPRETDRPTIALVEPLDRSEVVLEKDEMRSLPVRVRVENFKIARAGECGGVRNCGHVHIAVDPRGKACNYPGKPGNNTNAHTGGERIEALFAFCAEPLGRHELEVSLAYDNHAPVLIDGRPVSARIQVDVKE